MEFQSEAQIKAHLIQTDDTFRSLNERHSEYDRMISVIESKEHVTPDDEIEEHRLKKLKLQAKDQMRELMNRYAAHQNG